MSLMLIADVKFGVYFPDLSLSDEGNQLCCAIPMWLRVGFSVCDFQASSAGCWQCAIFFATCCQEVTSSSRGTISLVYFICKETHGTEQAIWSAQTHCSEPPGISFERRQFPLSKRHMPIDGQNLAREVLHATFFMPKVDADIPQAIECRIDYLHQISTSIWWSSLWQRTSCE